MMKYTCLNPIAACGLDQFTDAYEKVDSLDDAQAVLVRSAAMHDLELPETCLLYTSLSQMRQFPRHCPVTPF